MKIVILEEVENCKVPVAEGLKGTGSKKELKRSSKIAKKGQEAKNKRELGARGKILKGAGSKDPLTEPQQYIQIFQVMIIGV